MVSFFTCMANMIDTATMPAPQYQERCCVQTNIGTNSRTNSQSTAAYACSTDQPPKHRTNNQPSSIRFGKLFKFEQSICEEQQLTLTDDNLNSTPVMRHSYLDLILKIDTETELKSIKNITQKTYQKAVLPCAEDDGRQRSCVT